jgi:hypothetical protein
MSNKKKDEVKIDNSISETKKLKQYQSLQGSFI